MARNRRNHCGIASFASYPVVQIFFDEFSLPTSLGIFKNV